MNTPLWQALQAAVGRRAASFHTPGHKNGRIVPQALAAAWGSVFLCNGNERQKMNEYYSLTSGRIRGIL